jgi:hypothetical protein
MKTLVLVVAVTNVNDPRLSCFSPEIRLGQLKNTVDSVRDKIPDSFIVILEGSTLTLEQQEEIKLFNVDEIIVRNNEITPAKSLGEITMISDYLESSMFQELTKKISIKNFAKISGRYELTESFKFRDLDITVKKSEPHETWSGRGVCETRFYQFPFYMIEQYKEKLDMIKNNGIEIDIEHSFYEYDVVPHHNSVNEIGLKGYLAPTGILIND